MSLIFHTLNDIMNQIWALLYVLDGFLITRVRRTADCIIMGMVVLFNLWEFIATLNEIDPRILASFFTSTIDSCILASFFNRKCFFFSMRWIAGVAVSLTPEVLILCLPLLILVPLALPSRQKLWVGIVFSLSAL